MDTTRREHTSSILNPLLPSISTSTHPPTRTFLFPSYPVLQQEARSRICLPQHETHAWCESTEHGEHRKNDPVTVADIHIELSLQHRGDKNRRSSIFKLLVGSNVRSHPGRLKETLACGIKVKLVQRMPKHLQRVCDGKCCVTHHTEKITQIHVDGSRPLFLEHNTMTKMKLKKCTH